MKKLKLPEKKIKTYSVKFRCRNCNHKWEQNIKKGLFVVEGAGHSKYSGSPITAISAYQDGYFWESEIGCPNCGTNNCQKL